MIAKELQNVIREEVGKKVSFRVLSDNRLGVALPLTFGDGDTCEVIIEAEDDGTCTLSDDGYVLALGRTMGVGLRSTGYADRFNRLAAFYGAESQSGALKLTSTVANLGDSIFALTQACLELARLIDAPPEGKRKARAFSKKFRKLITATIPSERLSTRWHDQEADPEGIYPVDYRVESKGQNWLIFGASSPLKCWKGTTTVQHYKLKDLPMKSLFAYGGAVGTDQSAIGVVNDNADYVFSLESQRNELEKFLRKHVGAIVL